MHRIALIAIASLMAASSAAHDEPEIPLVDWDKRHPTCSRDVLVLPSTPYCIVILADDSCLVMPGQSFGLPYANVFATSWADYKLSAALAPGYWKRVVVCNDTPAPTE